LHTNIYKLKYSIWSLINRIYGLDNEEIPEEINIHKKIWGKNADQVVYGGDGRKEGIKDHTDQERCPFCDSRIDEFGYCACGGALG
jgi:hypothetical protein